MQDAMPQVRQLLLVPIALFAALSALLVLHAPSRAYVYRELSYQLIADRFGSAEDVRQFVYENASYEKASQAWPMDSEVVVYSDSWYYFERGMAWCDQVSVAMGTLLAKKGAESVVTYYIDKETGVSPHTILFQLASNEEDQAVSGWYDPLVEKGLLLPLEGYDLRPVMNIDSTWIDDATGLIPHSFIYLYQDFYLWMLGPQAPSLTDSTRHHGPPKMESDPELVLYYKARNYQLYGRMRKAQQYYELLAPGELARRIHAMMPTADSPPDESSM